MARPKGAVTGIGAAAVAAGAAAGAVAIERAARKRRRLGVLDPADGFEQAPDATRTVIASDGVSLHVEIDEPDAAASRSDGTPLTVVMAHGFTLNLDSWVFQRRALTAAGHRVVLWDQRSHGQSRQSTPEDSTILQLGRDLHDVIAATTPEGPIALVGHSMGGMTVMSLARQFPELITERVVAAALVATSAGGEGLTDLDLGPTFGQLAGRFGPTLLHRLNRYAGPLGRLRKLGRNIEDAMVERYSYDSPVSQALVRFTADMIFATSFETMANFLPALDKLNEEAALARLSETETVVINGLGDKLTPPDHSTRIVELLPGAEHVVVEDAGHLIMLEHPDVVSHQILMVIERGQLAKSRRVAISHKPRVRRRITDIARRRQVERAKERAKGGVG